MAHIEVKGTEVVRIGTSTIRVIQGPMKYVDIPAGKVRGEPAAGATSVWADEDGMVVATKEHTYPLAELNGSILKIFTGRLGELYERAGVVTHNCSP